MKIINNRIRFILTIIGFFSGGFLTRLFEASFENETWFKELVQNINHFLNLVFMSIYGLLIGILITFLLIIYWKIKDYLKEQEKYKLFVSAYTKLLSSYMIDAKIKIDPYVLKKEGLTIEEMKLLGFDDAFINSVVNSEPFKDILGR
jgi:hypothetical protein